MQFTPEQVISLAPDTASVKAGQKLASTAKWVARHQHEKALWGACKGSGKNPYTTMIDLGDLAFKCSCPSRKFPCKHALGLLFLFASQPTSFSQTNELADFVAEWLNKRAGRTEKQAIKKTANAKPVAAKAQQKRLVARTKKVEGGLLELRLWLKDVIRTGILQVPNEGYNFSKNIIARMVDAQASGLARELRAIEKINFYEEGWQQQLTKLLARLYFITEAYEQQAQLPKSLQAELRSLIGWTTPKEEVLAQEGMQDDWIILSKQLEEEDRIQVERLWLYGKTSRQFGLILNFYGYNQVPQHTFVAGSTLKAELVPYPGAFPLRMLIKSQAEMTTSFKEISAATSILSMYEAFGQVAAINPFITQFPVLLSNMSLVTATPHHCLRDQLGNLLVLQNSNEQYWFTAAFSQGKPFSCFGIFEQNQFSLHAIWQGNQYHAIS